MSTLSFEVWLFAIKKLAQTYDMALQIYEQLTESAKEDLKKEYEAFCKESK